MSAIVAAARRHVDATFRHRGRGPTRFDCAGIVWWAYHVCGVDLPDFRLYGGEPHQDGLLRHVTAALGKPIHVGMPQPDQLQPGDVLLMRFHEEPHHLAIVADYVLGGLGMIHADGHAGRVIEHRLADEHLRMITHVFRRPL